MRGERPIVAPTLDSIRKGGKASLAAALARLEIAAEAEDTLALLDEAYAAASAQTVGITGPPGVGKSSLTAALIGAWRQRGKTVAVIAVDPSSRRSGGALLGDRTRLRTPPEDQGIFVRSMAARDRLGGLASLTHSAMVLMRALFDIVMVETVGVGQSETEIAGSADTVILCLQPGSGDTLQFMKAGIVEIPQIMVVTKGDLGPTAEQTRLDARSMVRLAAATGTDGDWPVPVLLVSAQEGKGVGELADAVARHWQWLAESARLPRLRQEQAETWLTDAIRERWGREGLKRLDRITLPQGESPFRKLAELTARIGPDRLP